MPMINEAFFALMEGVASPEDIDAAMKLGTNQPMGPLALADLIGNNPMLLQNDTVIECCVSLKLSVHSVRAWQQRQLMKQLCS